MVKALKNAHQVKNKAAIDGWLFGILHNCWCDHFRRLKEVEDIDNVVLINEVTPPHVVEAHNIVEKVRHAVAALPVGQNQVVTLVDLEGFSYNEVAEILDVPIGTVMSRLCRARNALSKKLMELQSDVGITKASHLRSVK
jgi:RNA polymerase sigma-70 factor (ECF subfamily)